MKYLSYAYGAVAILSFLAAVLGKGVIYILIGSLWMVIYYLHLLYVEK